MKNKKDNKGSSFSLGLVIGTAIGAAGMYLSESPKGRQLKEQFIDEYEKAKKDLQDTPWEEVAAQLEKSIKKAKKSFTPPKEAPIAPPLPPKEKEEEEMLKTASLQETKTILEKLKAAAQQIVQDQELEESASSKSSENSRRFFTKSGSQMKK